MSYEEMVSYSCYSLSELKVNEFLAKIRIGVQDYHKYDDDVNSPSQPTPAERFDIQKLQCMLLISLHPLDAEKDNAECKSFFSDYHQGGIEEPIFDDCLDIIECLSN